MNIVALAGGLALFAIGLIFFAYLRHRRRKKVDSVKSIGTVSATKPATNATWLGQEKRTGGGRRRRFMPVAHERRFGLPRRRCDQPQHGMGNILTEEVDPLAEAEVCLADGHDGHAEYILKNAIAKDPARHELKVKLLAVYRQRQDEVAFYVLAEELYAALGGRAGQLWDQVEAMSRRLNSDSPVSRAQLRADGAAVSTGNPDAAGEAPWEAVLQTQGRQRRHADATKLELAKASLDMHETERALSLLREVLAPRAPDSTSTDGGVVTQKKESVTADYKGAERRRRTRRVQANRRGPMRWSPNEVDRRRGFGRRIEDRAPSPRFSLF